MTQLTKNIMCKASTLNDKMDLKSKSGDMFMIKHLIDFTNTTSSNDPDIALGTLDVITLAVFALIGIIIFIATVYDSYLIAKVKEIPQFVTALSLRANLKKLLAVNNSDDILCLHGIKSLCMIMMVIAHRLLIYTISPVNNTSDMLSVWSSQYFYPVVQFFELSIDTFLVTGGFLASHSLLRSLDKNKNFNLLSFLLHRWLRFTPSLAVVLLANVGLINHLGSGPLWKNMDIYLVHNCKKYWWSTSLFLQNYVNPGDLCMPHTWYLSVDMQLFMITSLIIVLTHRKNLLHYAVFGLLSTLSVVIGFIVALWFNLCGLLTKNFLVNKFEEYVVYYYLPTHTRLTPYLFGILLHRMVYTNSKKQITMNAVTVALRWIMTAVLLTVCLYGEYFLQYTPNEKLANAFYISLTRPAWAAGICWIILACVFDKSGFINNFLSHPVFQVLSRLSYNVYLVHFGIILMGVFRIVTPVHFDIFLSVVEGVGYLMVSLGCAIVLNLFVDLPASEIKKMVLKRKGEDKSKTT